MTRTLCRITNATQQTQGRWGWGWGGVAVQLRHNTNRVSACDDSERLITRPGKMTFLLLLLFATPQPACLRHVSHQIFKRHLQWHRMEKEWGVGGAEGCASSGCSRGRLSCEEKASVLLICYTWDKWNNGWHHVKLALVQWDVNSDTEAR